MSQPRNVPSRRLAVALLAAALTVPGCGAERPAGQESGSHEREAVSAASDTVWTLLDSPRFSIDRISSEPDGFLLQPAAGEILEDGSALVIDRGTGKLIWLDTAGVATRIAGGTGDGPGEFRSLSTIFRLPDSPDVWAWDSEARRLTHFNGDGEVASSRAVSKGGAAPEVLLPGPLFISTVREDGNPVGPGNFLFRDAAGEVMAKVPATRSSGRPSVTVEVAGRTMNHGVPAGCVAAPGIVGVGPDLLALDPSRGVVEAVGLDGSRSLRYRVEQREPVTPEQRSAVEAMVERRFTIPGREAPDHVRREALGQLRTLMGDTLPAWQDVIVDPAGALWLERPACPRSEGATTYSVADLESGGLGSVVLPDGLTVLAVRGREVLARRLDDLGVPHVELYWLVPRESR